MYLLYTTISRKLSNWYFMNIEHSVSNPTFEDTITTKTKEEDLKKDLAEVVGDTNIVAAQNLKTDDVFDNSNEKELDILSIKNTISGKAPESIYDKSINFKGVLANKSNSCGRSDKEVLKATVELDSLLDCEFNRLNNATQVNYLYYKYFKGDDEEKEEYNELTKTRKENTFIENLPYGDDCTDIDSNCPEWAKNGECVIDPKNMLSKCVKSCRACALTSTDKEMIIRILNSRDPYGCIYHAK